VSVGISCEPLEGPGLLSASVVEAEGKPVLRIAVPDNAAEGTYSARIVVSPREAGLANRFIPLTVEVAASGETAPPDDGTVPSLALETAQLDLESLATGWTRTSLPVAAAEGRPPVAVVGVRKASLRGREKFVTLSSEFDIQATPAPGWTGKELEPGRRSAFLLEFYVSSDLPDDVYEGEMAVQYRSGGDATVREAIFKVALRVNRAKGEKPR
jgi:hypothetical protein